MINCGYGWTDGSCCCNCENFHKLHKHPLNNNIGKGSILEAFAFVCAIENHFIFYEKPHGMCELHVPNTERKNFIEKNKLAKKFGI